MGNDAQILLQDVISFCRRDGQEQRLIKALEQCHALDYRDDTLYLHTPSRFAYSFLIKQRELIEGYLAEIAFVPTTLDIAPIEHEDTDTGVAGQAAPVMATPAVVPAAVPADPAGSVTAPAPQPTEVGYDSFGRGSAEPHKTPSGIISDSLAAAAATPITPVDEASVGNISVSTTISPAEFNRMTQEMNGNETSSRTNPTPIPAPSETADPAYPAVDINSKYTFDRFVIGVENKHAYQSATLFSAFADEPGEYTSLFIYGSSGLGKTHLLFAIKNYLMVNKPHIKVKYANSQVYIEDYLRELGAQKGPGERIMADYHNTDILIIDDIQNILGREQTIANFFQLMDEFIREGKKIVIAADRAPKDLNFDERLTSRFNQGLLCMVSEPGYEMKYMILKSYYQKTLLVARNFESKNLDMSLLSKTQMRIGNLSDDQLHHMAEISGTNIRSLESFCERCASQSATCEDEGRELTAEEIDSIASQYFNAARKIIYVPTVQKVVEEYYRVSHEDIISPRRTANIAWARHVAVYLTNSLCEMTTPAIGEKFGGRDHSTVLNSLKVVEKRMKEDRQIFEDIQTLKDKILLKS